MRANGRKRTTESGPAEPRRHRFAPTVSTLDIERPVGKADAVAILAVSVATLDTWTARCSTPHPKYDAPGNPGNRCRMLPVSAGFCWIWC